MQITTIGLDIAKNVFQVHGIDAAEKVVVRKQLRRGQVLKFFAALPPCLGAVHTWHLTAVPGCLRSWSTRNGNLPHRS
jgi:transposase